MDNTLHKESAAEKRQWLLANRVFIMFHSIRPDKKSRTTEKKRKWKSLYLTQWTGVTGLATW
jgi:hypothetical protein